MEDKIVNTIEHVNVIKQRLKTLIEIIGGFRKETIENNSNITYYYFYDKKADKTFDIALNEKSIRYEYRFYDMNELLYFDLDSKNTEKEWSKIEDDLKEHFKYSLREKKINILLNE